MTYIIDIFELLQMTVSLSDKFLLVSSVSMQLISEILIALKESNLVWSTTKIVCCEFVIITFRMVASSSLWSYKPFSKLTLGQLIKHLLAEKLLNMLMAIEPVNESLSSQ